MALASKSLDFMEPDLANKTEHQKWRRLVNRLFTDMFHRCSSRPAAEEFTLAAFSHEKDVTNQEFIRTSREVTFPGGQLVKKLEDEMARSSTRSITKLLAAPGKKGANTEKDMILKYIPELYGFRGHLPANKDVFYLSPWEFLKWWSVVRLPAPVAKDSQTQESAHNKTSNATKAPALSIATKTSKTEGEASYTVNPVAEQYLKRSKNNNQKTQTR